MFKLQPNPTFKTLVHIPIPGEKAEAVLFTFKHRTRSQLDELIKQMAENAIDFDKAVQEIVVEWTYPGVDYSTDALAQCLDMFPGSGLAIFTAFRESLLEAKRKN